MDVNFGSVISRFLSPQAVPEASKRKDPQIAQIQAVG